MQLGVLDASASKSFPPLEPKHNQELSRHWAGSFENWEEPEGAPLLALGVTGCMLWSALGSQMEIIFDYLLLNAVCAFEFTTPLPPCLPSHSLHSGWKLIVV